MKLIGSYLLWYCTWGTENSRTCDVPRDQLARVWCDDIVAKVEACDLLCLHQPCNDPIGIVVVEGDVYTFIV